jgi:hypothetical protein
LLLALLAVSPLLNPIFDNFIPSARAGPEEEFLKHMMKVLEDFTKELRMIARDFSMKMKVPPEAIEEQVAELAVKMVENSEVTYTWEQIGLQYKTWAENAVQILLRKGIIADSAEASQVLSALEGGRIMDAFITKARVLKDVVGGSKAAVDVTGELGGDILVEAKAVAAARAACASSVLLQFRAANRALFLSWFRALCAWSGWRLRSSIT